MFGKILKGILLVILGMVLGIAGVAGAGVIAYKSVTVGQIADIARLGEDVVGEELRGKTVEEAIAFVGSLSNQSVGEIEALFPIIETKIDELENYQIGSGKLSDLLTIDHEKLKAASLSDLGANFNEIFQITASLASLSTILEFSLPEMPLFDADSADSIANLPITEAMTELSARLNFNEMTLGDLQDDFGIKLFADASGEETLVDKILERDWAINDIAQSLTDKVDTLKLSDLDIHIDNDLFVKIIGEGEDELSIGEIQTEITARIDAIALGDIVTDIENTPLKSMAELTVGELRDGSTISQEIKNIALADVLEPAPDSVLYKICYYTENGEQKETTVGGLTDRVDSLKIGELIDVGDTPLKSMADMTIGELGEPNAVQNMIDDIALEDILGGSQNNKILTALFTMPDGGKTTVSQIGERLDTLVLGDMVEIPEGSFLVSFADLTVSDLGDSAKIQSTVDGVTLESVLGKDLTEGSILYAICYRTENGEKVPVTVGELGSRVEEVELKEILGEELAAQNPIIAALYEKGANLKNIGDVLSALTLTDVFADEITVFVEKEAGTYSSHDTYVRDAEGNYTKKENPSAGETVYRLSGQSNIWLFLLYDYDKETQTYRSAESVPLVKVNERVEAAAAMFNNVPLESLWEIGLLGTVDPDGANQPDEKIRDLTISELVTLVGKIPSSVWNTILTA